MARPAPQRRPTLATVAAEAGVSRQTVSNALNSPDLLRPDTLERVQEAIDRLGYSPNRAARNLRTRASHLIGLRVDPAVEGSANALMDRFLHSLVETAADAGYHVLLFTGGDARRPAGRRTTSCCGPPRSTPSWSPTPTAATRRPPGWSARRAVRGVRPALGRARRPAPLGRRRRSRRGRLAVDHLVERGHERIAWVGWQKGSYIGEDRRSGWARPDARARAVHDRLSARGEDTIDFGRRAAHALLDRPSGRPPSCASATPWRWACCGARRAAACAPGERRGRGRVRRLAGRAGHHAALTSVRQPLEQVAVEIVRYLGELLNHRALADLGCTLTPTLSVRDSS